MSTSRGQCGRSIDESRSSSEAVDPQLELYLELYLLSPMVPVRSVATPPYCGCALYNCPEYRPYFIQYAHSLQDFYRDYSAAHIKMSELGAKFRYKLTLETTDDE
jgi:hypothetical protein